ncbi:MAG: hypothetical protein ABSA16_01790 [Thermoguttaceae bacterium]|jgi:hypothetical protein
MVSRGRSGPVHPLGPILGEGADLKYAYAYKTLTVELPAAKRTRLVEVVCVELAPGK